MNDADVIRALGALAQETRLRIFRMLVVAGRQGVLPGHMADELGTSPTAISFHLKELVHAGLATSERDGRHLIYRAHIEQMNAVLGFLTAHCCEGQPCGVVPVDCTTAVDLPQRKGPMSSPVYNVLFICTGNSSRSIMAEAILNKQGGGRFRAWSAGSHPAGSVHPRTLELLERHHYKVDGLRSKNWNEFAGSDAPTMDFVLTVCDKAAGEVCPVWPGQPMSAHWGVEDPAAVEGSEEAQQRAFADAFSVLNRRIALLMVLPIDKLEKLALKRELDDIGRVVA